MPNATLAQTGILGLIADSGPVAKIVLIVLSGASVYCWAIIFTKWRTMKRAAFENAEFLNIFWHGKSLDEVLTKSDKYASSPMAAVFKSGVQELRKIAPNEDALNAPGSVDNIQRALIRRSTAEIASLEKHIGWLATTASAAPFVGLFGTVWGIMNAFQNIGASGAANLAVVAPGISEALITTATGIAAAIPAVVAYNHFGGLIRKMAVEMEGFSQDFINIVQRNVMSQNHRKGN
jgi:biopolymer transport protein TolQ